MYRLVYRLNWRLIDLVCVLFVVALVAATAAITLGLWPIGPMCGVLSAPVPPLKPYTEKIPDTDVSFDMVPIPGGTFEMGSPESEKGRGADEGPRHAVKIEPFWMGKCEVSWEEFDLFMKETHTANQRDNERKLEKDADAVTGPTGPYVDPDYGHPHEGHPALCMTQHGAMEYCHWLTKRTGKLYRLPTEAEWEYAARAGSKTAYFWGDDPARLDEFAWFAGNSDDTTHPVLSKKPNPWGLYNMYGNVMEWCVDQYDADFYKKAPLKETSLQPVNIPGPNRFPHVARGGSWDDKPAQLRSAARRGSDKTWIKLDPQQPKSVWWLTQMDTIGLRVVHPLDEQDNLKGLRSRVTLASKE